MKKVSCRAKNRLDHLQIQQWLILKNGFIRYLSPLHHRSVLHRQQKIILRIYNPFYRATKKQLPLCKEAFSSIPFTTVILHVVPVSMHSRDEYMTTKVSACSKIYPHFTERFYNRRCGLFGEIRLKKVGDEGLELKTLVGGNWLGPERLTRDRRS